MQKTYRLGSNVVNTKANRNWIAYSIVGMLAVILIAVFTNLVLSVTEKARIKNTVMVTEKVAKPATVIERPATVEVIREVIKPVTVQETTHEINTVQDPMLVKELSAAIHREAALAQDNKEMKEKLAVAAQEMIKMKAQLSMTQDRLAQSRSVNETLSEEATELRIQVKQQESKVLGYKRSYVCSMAKEGIRQGFKTAVKNSD